MNFPYYRVIGGEDERYSINHTVYSSSVNLRMIDLSIYVNASSNEHLSIEVVTGFLTPQEGIGYSHMQLTTLPYKITFYIALVIKCIFKKVIQQFDNGKEPKTVLKQGISRIRLCYAFTRCIRNGRSIMKRKY